MYKIIITILTTIFCGVAIGLIGYYIQKEKPEVLYNVSSPISISIPSSSIESVYVQQISVKNIGSKEALNLTVKINTEVINHNIDKYAQNDVVTITPKKDGIEFSYKELPPQGEFTITLQVKKSITISDVKVFHKDGIAKEAFSKVKTSDFIIIMLLSLLCIIFAANFVMSFRDSLLYNRINNSTFESANTKLKNDCPWYISKKKWIDIRNKYISIVEDSLRKEQQYSEINKTKYYLFLNNEKPPYFSDDEFTKLLKAAEDGLSTHIGKIIIEPIFSDEELKHVLHILDVNKPIHLSVDKWDRLRTNIAKSYVTNSILLSIRHNIRDIENALKVDKPENIDNSLWDRYIKFHRNYYFNHLCEEINIADNPFIYLQNNNLALLEQVEKVRINIQAYRIYFNNLYSSILEKDGYEKYLNSEKPKWLSNDDHLKLKEIAQDFKTRKMLIEKENELKSTENALKTKERELLPLIEKITKQLQIIQEVLDDPNAIDRIEDYNQPFSKGNFDNLKRIATYLRTLATNKKE